MLERDSEHLANRAVSEFVELTPYELVAEESEKKVPFEAICVARILDRCLIKRKRENSKPFSFIPNRMFSKICDTNASLFAVSSSITPINDGLQYFLDRNIIQNINYPEEGYSVLNEKEITRIVVERRSLLTK